MDFEKIKAKVLVCLGKLKENEQKIIANNIGERTITHKLAEYLQQEFPDYDVDCEYNRNIKEGENTPKYYDRVSYVKSEHCKSPELKEDPGQISAYPDIIVHERLFNRNNLLIIEVKKDNNNGDWSVDDEKLCYFTDKNKKYGFQFGLHIEFFVKDQWKEPNLRWYINGNYNPKL